MRGGDAATGGGTGPASGAQRTMSGAFTDEFITRDASDARHEVHIDELLTTGLPKA